ncbi:hypothetical protein SASPL_120286 [Salvia splendens]|uniref:Cupin type-1 domain-containing protein n=1 Tax=Salvia splendens TaxID=180675 RepID=A0A8X8XSN9_SALSN|nr:hypothetical protein SASPL_120286 [Salvia splendens]
MAGAVMYRMMAAVAGCDALQQKLKLNGYSCKSNVTAEDFFSGGLAKPGATNTSTGSAVNTLGVSLASVDYAPGGLNPPHKHPRATEVVLVLKGELDVGFITTANVLISKSIKEGDIFLPGTQSIAETLFAASPPVPDNVLTKAFQVDKIKSKFAP